LQIGEKMVLIVFDQDTPLQEPLDYVDRLSEHGCRHWYALDRSLHFDNTQNDRTIEMMSQSLAEWSLHRLLTNNVAQ
jgi:hypothetical protein